MICPKCNKRYDESDKFCIDCGTKLIKNRDIQSVKPQVESEIGSLDVQLVKKHPSTNRKQNLQIRYTNPTLQMVFQDLIK